MHLWFTDSFGDLMKYVRPIVWIQLLILTSAAIGYLVYGAISEIPVGNSTYDYSPDGKWLARLTDESNRSRSLITLEVVPRGDTGPRKEAVENGTRLHFTYFHDNSLDFRSPDDYVQWAPSSDTVIFKYWDRISGIDGPVIATFSISTKRFTWEHGAR